MLDQHFPGGAGQPVEVFGSPASGSQVAAALRSVDGLTAVTRPVILAGHAYIEATLTSAPDSQAAYDTIDRARAAVHPVPGVECRGVVVLHGRLRLELVVCPGDRQGAGQLRSADAALVRAVVARCLVTRTCSARRRPGILGNIIVLHDKRQQLYIEAARASLHAIAAAR